MTGVNLTAMNKSLICQTTRGTRISSAGEWPAFWQRNRLISDRREQRMLPGFDSPGSPLSGCWQPA